ncbi:MAG: HEAT repeat domain-containing protein [Gammaproteobacteria bacterium]
MIKINKIQIIFSLFISFILVVYLITPENKKQDIEMSSQSIEINNINTKHQDVGALKKENCETQESNYHCSDEITNLLASQDTIEKMSGLNLLWRFIDEHYTDLIIESQLQQLKTDDNFKIKDLAIFISNKIIFLRNPEIASTPEETLISKIESNDVYQDMTEFSTEANLAEKSGYQANENTNAISLDDSDINVRMTALENIIVQRNDNAVELVSKALTDSESDIRLIAVDGLGQFLNEGFGEPQVIVNSLQKSLDDRDTKIVELTQELLTQHTGLEVNQNFESESE